MDNIFCYTEKQLIQNPLQIIYDIDQIIKGQEPQELKGIVYFQNMKNFVIQKHKLEDNIQVYHLKLKEQHLYGQYPIIKKILRKWIVVYGNKSDLKNFKILQKSKEHMYENKIEYFQDKGIDFKKFKEDCDHQKNLYRAHNQFLNFYLNKNFKIEKSFKYYFLADTCYRKFLKLLPNLQKQVDETQSIKQDQNLLLIQVQQKQLQYYVASYCSLITNWVISDQDNLYICFKDFAQTLEKEQICQKQDFLNQFHQFFIKNMYIETFCQQKNLSVIFYIQKSKIIFETFVYNNQTINQFPPFFVSKIFEEFKLPFYQAEAHIIQNKEKLNEFVKNQYKIFEQDFNKNYNKKLTFNIILDNKKIFEIEQDRQIFYQCYFSQKLNIHQFAQRIANLHNKQQINEFQDILLELDHLQYDKLITRKFQYFSYYMFYNQIQKKDVIKYTNAFFNFNKVRKYSQLQQQFSDWQFSIYRKLGCKMNLQNPSNYYNFKNEVCKRKFIKIIFIQQAPYQINEDFKLSIIDYLAQKKYVVFRIQDLVQNLMLKQLFKTLDFDEKQKIFKGIDILELIQQILQEIKFIYRKKFCLLIDQNIEPQNIIKLVADIRQLIQYYGFSTNFLVLNCKNKQTLSNLQIGKQIINFPFSVEMIFQILNQFKNQENVSYEQAVDSTLQIFCAYLKSDDPFLQKKYDFQVKESFNFDLREQDYLLAPFFQTLFQYLSFQSNIKNLKHLQKFQITRQKLVQTLKKIEENCICPVFIQSNYKDFVKKHQQLLNSTSKDQNIQFQQNIIYYAVFFNKNIETKFIIELNGIQEKLDFIEQKYKDQVSDFIQLKNYQNSQNLKFARNQHMTVCYLGNKEPNKQQKIIIDSYTIGKQYSFYTKYLVFIQNKIGFFILEQNEYPSCNKFEHSTIYYCNNYLPTHSNNMAERVNQQIIEKNEIYTCKEQSLKIYKVEDLFDKEELNAYVWKTRIRLDGIFNFILGNFQLNFINQSKRFQQCQKNFKSNLKQVRINMKIYRLAKIQTYFYQHKKSENRMVQMNYINEHFMMKQNHKEINFLKIIYSQKIIQKKLMKMTGIYIYQRMRKKIYLKSQIKSNKSLVKVKMSLRIVLFQKIVLFNKCLFKQNNLNKKIQMIFQILYQIHNKMKKTILLFLKQIKKYENFFQKIQKDQQSSKNTPKNKNQQKGQKNDFLQRQERLSQIKKQKQQLQQNSKNIEDDIVYVKKHKKTRPGKIENRLLDYRDYYEQKKQNLKNKLKKKKSYDFIPKINKSKISSSTVNDIFYDDIHQRLYYQGIENQKLKEDKMYKEFRKVHTFNPKISKSNKKQSQNVFERLIQKNTQKNIDNYKVYYKDNFDAQNGQQLFVPKINKLNPKVFKQAYENLIEDEIKKKQKFLMKQYKQVFYLLSLNKSILKLSQIDTLYINDRTIILLKPILSKLIENNKDMSIEQFFEFIILNNQQKIVEEVFEFLQNNQQQKQKKKNIKKKNDQDDNLELFIGDLNNYQQLLQKNSNYQTNQNYQYILTQQLY